jgi:hypothetical protein
MAGLSGGVGLKDHMVAIAAGIQADLRRRCERRETREANGSLTREANDSRGPERRLAHEAQRGEWLTDQRGE